MTFVHSSPICKARGWPTGSIRSSQPDPAYQAYFDYLKTLGWYVDTYPGTGYPESMWTPGAVVMTSAQTQVVATLDKPGPGVGADGRMGLPLS